MNVTADYDSEQKCYESFEPAFKSLLNAILTQKHLILQENFYDFFALKLRRIALKSKCLSLLYGEKPRKMAVGEFCCKAPFSQ